MAMWKPGTKGPGVLERQGDEALGVIVNKNKNLPLITQRQRLPIYANRKQILYLLEHYRTVVVVGETGTGKTTQIPQYLHEAGWSAGGRVVGCTQPRRVAAQTVAARVAEEMGTQLGQICGYTVRFDDKSDPAVTRVKFLTDGILIREMMGDPLLSRYSVLMIDEAHERSVCTDVLIGLLKKVQKRRKELRLIISSATLDAEVRNPSPRINQETTLFRRDPMGERMPPWNDEAHLPRDPQRRGSNPGSRPRFRSQEPPTLHSQTRHFAAFSSGPNLMCRPPRTRLGAWL
jgi:hypothetical protein